MRANSKQFRKSLLRIDERTPSAPFAGGNSTKLSRIVTRDTITGTLEDLDLAMEQLDAEVREWSDAKWNRRINQ
jgi:hypothetical protein